MAQRMAPTKVGSKKVAKKPSDRKDALTTSSKAAKAKPKAAPLKSHAKAPVKTAPAKPQHPKGGAHAAVSKSAPHAKVAVHKAPAKEPARTAAKGQATA